MWPFSRKRARPTGPPAANDATHEWGVAQGTFEDAPLIVRYNETAKAWDASNEFPIKLGFAVPLRSPNEGGLPDPDENASLDDVEDLICEHVALATPGVHALVLTTGIMKEYIFYIPADVDIQSLHENIQSAVDSHEVQCIAEHEPKWDTYHGFLPD